jgi:hypothetical protein
MLNWKRKVNEWRRKKSCEKLHEKQIENRKFQYEAHIHNSMSIRRKKATSVAAWVAIATKENKKELFDWEYWTKVSCFRVMPEREKDKMG